MPNYKHPSLKGIPTADQEALQQPWFDPVTIAANMGGGLYEAAGKDLAGSMLKDIANEGGQISEYLPQASEHELPRFLERFDHLQNEWERLHGQGPSLMEHLSHLYRGTTSSVRPTVAAQLLTNQLTNRHNPYLESRMGTKTNNLFDFVDWAARQGPTIEER